MIIKPYRYLFYRLYSWDLKKWGRADNPFSYAAGAIAVLLALNFYTLLSVMLIVTGHNLLNTLVHLSKLQLFIGALVYIAFISFLFLRKRKYKKYLEEFKNENNRSRTRGTIFVWSYIIGTILTSAFSAYLAGQTVKANFTVIEYLHTFFTS